MPVRLMEGRSSVTFSSRGRLRMRFTGAGLELEKGAVEKVVESPPGSAWTVRVVRSQPASLTSRIQLAELRFSDKQGLAAERRLWEERGYRVRLHTLGSLYGISGKVVDNRRYLLLLDEPIPPEQVGARQAELFLKHGTRTSLFEEGQQPARGQLELLEEAGRTRWLPEGRVLAESPDGSPFEVRQVEHDVGYSSHGFEDRSYRGSLLFTLDRFGKLAAVNLISMEELLQGLVPAEIFARAHPEALKAQAVTARSEVMAKIGLKHLADPYLLCAEQHCAVYRGLSQEAASTSAAVQSTRGEALFAQDGRLVDSVYSAVCGGHTENNEVVWGTPPDPSLRGRPDLLPGRKLWVRPRDLPGFLQAELPVACRLSSFAQPAKYRWERRFTAYEVDALTASLGVGRVRVISVAERGVSGRARLLTLSGELGATQVRGELNIRRLFGMLNSAMFTVAPEHAPGGELSGWLFSGGGWGHGVGLCQTGAIGRAEAGQSYRQILGHYFNGAKVSRIYE